MHPPHTLGLLSDGLLVASELRTHISKGQKSPVSVTLPELAGWMLRPSGYSVFTRNLSSAFPHPVYLLANQACAKNMI